MKKDLTEISLSAALALTCNINTPPPVTQVEQDITEMELEDALAHIIKSGHTRRLTRVSGGSAEILAALIETKWCYRKAARKVGCCARTITRTIKFWGWEKSNYITESTEEKKEVSTNQIGYSKKFRRKWG